MIFLHEIFLYSHRIHDWGLENVRRRKIIVSVELRLQGQSHYVQVEENVAKHLRNPSMDSKSKVNDLEPFSHRISHGQIENRTFDDNKPAILAIEDFYRQLSAT